jgi:hypothetical protein
VVAQICNPSTGKEEAGDHELQARLGYTVRPCLKNQQSQRCWLTPVIVEGQFGQTVGKARISKITRAKWIGGVAQVLEHLLCKGKTLSSNPSSTKKSKLKKDNLSMHEHVFLSPMSSISVSRSCIFLSLFLMYGTILLFSYRPCSL